MENGDRVVVTEPMFRFTWAGTYIGPCPRSEDYCYISQDNNSEVAYRTAVDRLKHGTEYDRSTGTSTP